MKKRILCLVLSLAVASACSPMVVVGDESIAPSLQRIYGPLNCSSVEPADRSKNIDGTACLNWPVRRFEYHVDEKGLSTARGDEVFDAVDRAFATWQAAANLCSDFQFVEGIRMGNAERANDGKNVILFRESDCRTAAPAQDACWNDSSCANKYQCWDKDENSLSFTTTHFKNDTGEILDADIEVNASRVRYETDAQALCPPGEAPGPSCAYDLQSVITREIGIALGLDSRLSSLPSTMSPSLEPGSIALRNIDVVTHCFVCETYPRDQPTAACQ